MSRRRGWHRIPKSIVFTKMVWIDALWKAVDGEDENLLFLAAKLLSECIPVGAKVPKYNIVNRINAYKVGASHKDMIQLFNDAIERAE